MSYSRAIFQKILRDGKEVLQKWAVPEGSTNGACDWVDTTYEQEPALNGKYRGHSQFEFLLEFMKAYEDCNASSHEGMQIFLGNIPFPVKELTEYDRAPAEVRAMYDTYVNECANSDRQAYITDGSKRNPDTVYNWRPQMTFTEWLKNKTK